MFGAASSDGITDLGAQWPYVWQHLPDIGPLVGILYNFTPLVNGAGLAIYGFVRV